MFNFKVSEDELDIPKQNNPIIFKFVLNLIFIVFFMGFFFFLNQQLSFTSNFQCIKVKKYEVKIICETKIKPLIKFSL